ncbi:uncharacterized protein LOC135958762 [Calliphora vicina]|uniref:uncharacterized protein LOC135958762 n=1 Tax=Calliphora vicina TaxID=7373 RepID=UPI00325C1098
MFKQRQVFLALLAVVAVNAMGFSLQYKGNMRHPELPNHCYFTEHDLTIPINETVYPTNLKYTCVKVLCREDFVLEIRHCQNLDPHHICQHTAYDYTKPYPDCCPIVTCEDRVYRSENY